MSVYTPPALNAVDFALTAHTVPSIVSPTQVLTGYTVPALAAVNFELVVYTVPTYPNVGWELLPAAGGTVTGTLAATEAGADTAALTGDVLIAGALAATEAGADTAALAGDVIVQGALAGVEAGADTAALAGAVQVSGTMSATETGSDEIGGYVDPDYVAPPGYVLPGVDGRVLVQGLLAAMEDGADTASIAGTVERPDDQPEPAQSGGGWKRSLAQRQADDADRQYLAELADLQRKSNAAAVLAAVAYAELEYT